MDLTAPTTLLHAWLLAPAVMVLGMAGLGAGLAALSGLRLGALTLPAGFLAGAALMSFLLGVGVDGIPAVVVCALASLVGAASWLRGRRSPAAARREPPAAVAVGGRTRGVHRWPAFAFLAAYAIGLAPLAGSGRAGVVGYILNNDPATHLTVVALLREHGAATVDAQVSTYGAVSALFAGGYPVGSHVWVLFTSVLGLVDPFLIWTPVISVGLGLIALVSYALLRDLHLPRPAAAVAAVLVGCGYLTYSYAAQGGAKEVFASLSIYGTIALVFRGIRGGATWRRLVPGALGLAAGLAVFGLAIVPWLGTAAGLVAAVLVWRARRGERSRTIVALAAAGGVAAVFALPAVLGAIRFARTSGEAIENPAQTGNLLGPVPWWEAFNVWLGSDYRYPTPDIALPTYALIAVAALLAALGVTYAIGSRRLAVPLAVAAAVVGAVFVSSRYAIYFDAKTYMLMAPAFGLATAAGAWALYRLARFRRLARLGALSVAAALALGALASDALVYAGAWITPKERFQELARIAERLPAGPVLIADREEYARYFLRADDPWDDWGEWQPRRNFRFGAVPPPPPRGPDLDDYPDAHIQSFATLLERKRPGGSRAPGNFEVAFETPSYRVWKKTGPPPQSHLPLGLEELDGDAPLDCAAPEVAALLEAARTNGARLRVARSPAPVVVSPPTRWQTYGAATWPGPAERMVFRSGGFALAEPPLPAGRYDVWMQGSFGPGFRLHHDQRALGDVFGDLGLHSGWHLVEPGVRVTGADPQFVIGGFDKPRWQSGWRRPDLHGALAFEASESDPEITTVTARRAQSLCGDTLDWVELLG